MQSASLSQIYNQLLQTYGRQYWWPVFRDGNSVYDERNQEYPRSQAHQWEIALGALLTQNTAWTNVEKVFLNLQENGGWSPSTLEEMELERLSALIRSGGYHNQKAKKIRALLTVFPHADFSPLLEKEPSVARSELLAVWGIGPETADSILLYALGIPFFVVDAYTRRIFTRLGVLPEKCDYDCIQRIFENSIEEDRLVYQEYHALIVKHAKEHCGTKPQCEACPLQTSCFYYLSAQ